MDEGPRVPELEGLVQDRAMGEWRSWGQTLDCGHPLGDPHT